MGNENLARHEIHAHFTHAGKRLERTMNGLDFIGAIHAAHPQAGLVDRSYVGVEQARLVRRWLSSLSMAVVVRVMMAFTIVCRMSAVRLARARLLALVFRVFMLVIHGSRFPAFVFAPPIRGITAFVVW